MADLEEAPAPAAPSNRNLRDTFGHFATGVTVITALHDGEPVGMAANSFTSLSLDPPLVLFCAGRSSSTWPRVEAAGAFTVNILGEGHDELCAAFASKDGDRFAGASWHVGTSGAPVLDDAIAHIDCVLDAVHPGGDHLIVVGRVVDDHHLAGARPLVFFQGRYAALAASR